MQARKMRILRRKYGISLRELAEVCNCSQQWVSAVELSTNPLTPAMAAKVRGGFEKLVEQHQNQLLQLSQDYERHKDTLLNPVEEIGNEL